MMRNAEPSSAAARMKRVTVDATKVRRGNNLGGRNGELALACQKAKARISSAPAVNDPITSPLLQPAVLPRTKPQVTPNAPTVMSGTPMMSRLEAGPLD